MKKYLFYTVLLLGFFVSNSIVFGQFTTPTEVTMDLDELSRLNACNATCEKGYLIKDGDIYLKGCNSYGLDGADVARPIGYKCVKNYIGTYKKYNNQIQDINGEQQLLGLPIKEADPDEKGFYKPVDRSLIGILHRPKSIQKNIFIGGMLSSIIIIALVSRYMYKVLIRTYIYLRKKKNINENKDTNTKEPV